MNGFREQFKYYKRKDEPPNFDNVIDLNKINSLKSNEQIAVRVILKESDIDWELNFGMKNPSEWEIYTFCNNPGLIFIKNPFYSIGQRYWIIRCLEYYTRKPSKLNIDAHDIINTNGDWWEFCHRENNKNGPVALEKLRWATFGYHHNWDTKVYSESSKCDFPLDLNNLCCSIAKEFNFLNFNAEAAIVNLYNFGSSLSGHTDHSELNVQAPLFSFSFGQSAIFLIGGKSLENSATPILLESGDILIMSGDSRLCYHGVPRILPSKTQPWTENLENYNNSCQNKYFLNEILEKASNDKEWEPFEKYINRWRINVNVRQVLFPEQKTLEDNS